MGFKTKAAESKIKKYKYQIKELEEALFDILDGNSQWHDIKYFTGLSDERCIEISDIWQRIAKKRKDNK